MSSADEILYAPVYRAAQDHELISKTKQALDDPQFGFEFRVDANTPITVYDRIAELVENDPTQIAVLQQAVSYDPKQIYRPKNALAIRDVFRRLHNGVTNFYFTAKLNGIGIRNYEFENWFAIDHCVPVVRLQHQNDSNNRFEWWVLSLMSNFDGYSMYYAFGTEPEAQAYYTTFP
jgi:hypothetical protein